MSKEEMISLIELIYSFNPDPCLCSAKQGKGGKGKQRKRTIEDTLALLNQKAEGASEATSSD